MRSYIEELADELASSGRDVAQLLATVRATPWAQQLLARFAALVAGRC